MGAYLAFARRERAERLEGGMRQNFGFGTRQGRPGRAARHWAWRQSTPLQKDI